VLNVALATVYAVTIVGSAVGEWGYFVLGSAAEGCACRRRGLPRMDLAGVRQLDVLLDEAGSRGPSNPGVVDPLIGQPQTAPAFLAGQYSSRRGRTAAKRVLLEAVTCPPRCSANHFSIRQPGARRMLVKHQSHHDRIPELPVAAAPVATQSAFDKKSS
jgi:hypothetical protein